MMIDVKLIIITITYLYFILVIILHNQLSKTRKFKYDKELYPTIT